MLVNNEVFRKTMTKLKLGNNSSKFYSQQVHRYSATFLQQTVAWVSGCALFEVDDSQKHWQSDLNVPVSVAGRCNAKLLHVVHLIDPAILYSPNWRTADKRCKCSQPKLLSTVAQC